LPGEQVRLEEVLLIGDSGEVACGQPNIPGAAVIALLRQQGKARKWLFLSTRLRCAITGKRASSAFYQTNCR